jgi:hypothetical protein
MFQNEYLRIRKAFIEDMFGGIVLSKSKVMLADMIVQESDAIQHSMIPPMARPAPEIQSKKQLVYLLGNAKQSPLLGAYIREKAHRCDMVTFRPALFEQGQISRDYWSKLLNDEIRASKEKLLRVAVLLQLSVVEAEEMLDKAGYSMSPAILRDVVVEYCLEHRYNDFNVIEQMLADHEIQSLFNDRRSS